MPRTVLCSTKGDGAGYRIYAELLQIGVVSNSDLVEAMRLSDVWVNLFLSCNDCKDLVWFDNVQQQKPAMMGISRTHISPMAGPSWQLLHCAVHGPHG